METILKLSFDDSSHKYLIKVSNKEIQVVPSIQRIYNSNECSAICAGKAMVEHIYNSKRINVNIQEVDIHEAFIESMRRNPVFRVLNQESDTAKRLNIKPWHHCFSYGA